MEYPPQERGYRTFFKCRFKIVSYEAILRFKNNFSWTLGEGFAGGIDPILRPGSAPMPFFYLTKTVTCILI